jgi:hypothetical protein
MGACVGKEPIVTTTTTNARASMRFDVVPQRASPRTFSVVSESIDQCLDTLSYTIQNTWEHQEVEVLHLRENNNIVMRVGTAYYPVDVIKFSAKNRYQASVSIK